MTNNYNLELIKERIEEDKFTIRYGNIYLPEELIIEAYDTIQNQKSLEYDAKMMDKCREICDEVRELYPDIKFKIHKTGDKPFEDRNWFIYSNMLELDINEDEFMINCGKITYDLYLNKIFEISLVTNKNYHNEYLYEEGEWYCER